MKDKRNRLLSLLLCMVLAVTAIPSSALAAEASVQYVEYNNVANNYRGQQKTAPDKTGYVFAGWYEKEGSSYSAMSEAEADGATNAYAKFVDEKVLSVRFQLTAGTTVQSADTDLRVLTSVDDLEYSEVGFIIQADDKAVTMTSQTVYESITGYVGEDEISYTASEAFDNAVSAYFAAYNVVDIENINFFTDWTVIPTWTTKDGTVVEGVEKEFSITNDRGYMGVVPETFEPVVRFAVASDAHVTDLAIDESNEHVEGMFDSAYAYSDNADGYSALDAVVFVGDIVDYGRAAEYEYFFDITDEKLRNGTEMIIGLGNHEYYTSKTEAENVFKEASGYDEVDVHKTINGYHFISMSPSTGNDFNSSQLTWLSSQLQIAAADDPTGTKPIFVFQHYPSNGLLGGSDGNTRTGVDNILKNYPQIVDFSGHSHFPISDPRSMVQVGYTILNTGSLSYYGYDIVGVKDWVNPKGYEGDYVGSWVQKDGEQYYIIEADAKGAVVIRIMDVTTGTTFGDPIYLEAVADTDTHLSNAQRKELETVPTFSKNATVKADITEYAANLNFPHTAKGGFVQHYRCELYQGETRVDTIYKLSCQIYASKPETMKVCFDNLTANTEYTAKIYPVSSWGKVGEPLVYNFTTADIFTADTVAGTDGNVTLQNNVTGTSYVTYYAEQAIKEKDIVAFNVSVQPAQSVTVMVYGCEDENTPVGNWYSQTFEAWTGTKAIVAKAPSDANGYRIRVVYNDSEQDYANNVVTITNARVVSPAQEYITFEDELHMSNIRGASGIQFERVSYAEAGIDAPADGGTYVIQGDASAPNCQYPKLFVDFGATYTMSTTVTYNVRVDVDPDIVTNRTWRIINVTDNNAAVTGLAFNKWQTITTRVPANTSEISMYINLDNTFASWKQEGVDVKIYYDNFKVQAPAPAFDVLDFETEKDMKNVTGNGQVGTINRVAYADTNISADVATYGSYALKAEVKDKWPVFTVDLGRTYETDVTMTFNTYLQVDPIYLNNSTFYPIDNAGAISPDGGTYNTWSGFRVTIPANTSTYQFRFNFDMNNRVKDATKITVYMDNFTIIEPPAPFGILDFESMKDMQHVTGNGQVGTISRVAYADTNITADASVYGSYALKAEVKDKWPVFTINLSKAYDTDVTMTFNTYLQVDPIYLNNSTFYPIDNAGTIRPDGGTYNQWSSFTVTIPANTSTYQFRFNFDLNNRVKDVTKITLYMDNFEIVR